MEKLAEQVRHDASGIHTGILKSSVTRAWQAHFEGCPYCTWDGCNNLLSVSMPGDKCSAYLEMNKAEAMLFMERLKASLENADGISEMWRQYKWKQPPEPETSDDPTPS